MPQSEQTRLQVLNSLLAEHMTLDQAATLNGCQYTPHQAHSDGLPGEGRCRRCTRSPWTQTRQRDTRGGGGRCCTFGSTRYGGANHTHLGELLSEREDIGIGRTALRRILVNAGLSSPRKKRLPKHRVRRQRMPRRSGRGGSGGTGWPAAGAAVEGGTEGKAQGGCPFGGQHTGIGNQQGYGKEIHGS